MKEIIDKISSYNLFNYLLPGVIYIILTDKFTNIDLVIENTFIGAFLYYFIGLVISRLGSIIIQPLFEKWKIVKFAEYCDFISESKKDEKIELLSEANNTFRTFTSLFLILIITILYDYFLNLIINPIITNIIISTVLLVIFALAYRKQTSYITKRIKNSMKK